MQTPAAQAGLPEIRSRDRIIRTSTAMFAVAGFGATSTRDICGHAQVNPAAINYNFRSKEGLYREIYMGIIDQVEHAFQQANIDVTRGTQCLKPYYLTLLSYSTGSSHGADQMGLLLQEDIRPTGLVDDLQAHSFAARTEPLMSLLKHQFRVDHLDAGLQRLLVTLHGLAQPYLSASNPIAADVTRASARESQIDDAATYLADIATALLRTEQTRGGRRTANSFEK